jgi:hypothetical protein
MRTASRRAELKSLLEAMIPTQGPSQHGFLGSTRCAVLDYPDLLVEIADWESAEARIAHLHEAQPPAPTHLCSS